MVILSVISKESPTVFLWAFVHLWMTGYILLRVGCFIVKF